MSELKKAKLQAINADGSNRGEAIPVQFNPSSLRLQITNQVEGGATRGKQVRQYTGSSSTTLTVDLIFDTADEGTTAAPVSVRSKTMAVEQFLYPQGEGTQKQAPPRLRFTWGDLVLEGVVESLNIDLDHFAPSGVPLRAKVGFSFKEQDRRYEAGAAGDGANDQGGAPNSGEATAGTPGSSGSEGAGQVAAAIGGESAAEFAARLGLDAAAWRGLSFGASLGGSLSLEAGLEVGFSAGLSASAGVGIFAGASAGASVSLEAAFGLEASLGVTAVANVGFDLDLQQGFSVSAAGGVSAALETVKTAKAETAVAQTLSAFSGSVSSGASGSIAGPTASSGGGAAPAVSGASAASGGSSALAAVSRTSVKASSGGASAARPGLPDQSRTPMRLAAGSPPPAVGVTKAASAPPPPVADSRATSFGFGIPLRPTVRKAGGLGATSIQGTVAVVARSGGATEAPTTYDPTVPPWEALPAASTTATSAGQVARAKGRTTPRCGCG